MPTPTEILSSAKKDIPFYFLSDYIDNLKADGDFSLAGTEESMLSSALNFYAVNGNPNRVVSFPISYSEEESTAEIDFPAEFAAMIQVRDRNLQNIPYEIDTANSKIIVTTGPCYLGPYKLRYRFKLEEYFGYSVDDASGVVTVSIDKDIDVAISDLIKNLLKAKLNKYNKKISEVSRSVQMELPVSENEGEQTLAEDEIRGQVRVQPSLMSF